jgi:hypothetical protein
MFKDKSELEQHLQLNHNNKPKKLMFKCSFETSPIPIEEDVHNFEDSVDATHFEEKNAVSQQPSSLLSYQVCQKIQQKKDLIPNKVKGALKNIKTFNCSFCAKKFRLNFHLQQHIKGAHRNVQDFECTIYSLNFANCNDLWWHMKTIQVQKYSSNAVELNDKTFFCLLCSKTFLQITHLLVHVKKVHDDFVKLRIKKFKFSICAVKFVRKIACKQHFSLVYQNSKNYICVICTETFAIKFTEE